MGYTINTLKKIGAASVSETGTVNAGASETTTITADAGKIWQIIGMQLSASPVPASASGTHEFELYLDSGTTDLLVGIIKGVFNAYISIQLSVFSGGSSENPSSDAAQGNLIHHGLFCSDSIPIGIKYSNDADTNQTVARTIKYVYLETIER